MNNVMTMGNVAVAAEAMVLGVKAGMDPQRLFDILSTSGGRSHHFLKRFPNVLAGDFAPRFSIALSRKDLGLAARLAESLGVPMLTTAVVRQVYEAAAAAGLDGQDMAAVTALFERWAGVEVRAPSRMPPRVSDAAAGWVPAGTTRRQVVSTGRGWAPSDAGRAGTREGNEFQRGSPCAGPVKRVQQVASSLISVKGVRYGQLVPATTGKHLV